MSSITEPNQIGAPFTVGIALDGAGWHPAAWRDGSARPDELFSAAYWEQLVGIAEAVGGVPVPDGPVLFKGSGMAWQDLVVAGAVLARSARR